MKYSKLDEVTQGRARTGGVSPFMELDITKVYPNPNQPRKNFNNIEELGSQIKRDGLIQPIAVVKKEDGYMIVSGERRYRASLHINAKTIKAHVLHVSDHKVMELALIENIQREDLTDFEKAKHIGELWASGQYEKKQDLAEAIGKGNTPSYISKAFSCLKLDETIITDLEEAKHNISLSVLEEISRVKDKELQKEAYTKYLAKEITRDDIAKMKSTKISHGKKEKYIKQTTVTQGKHQVSWACSMVYDDIKASIKIGSTYRITIEEV